jgi:hypothetical protein
MSETRWSASARGGRENRVGGVQAKLNARVRSSWSPGTRSIGRYDIRGNPDDLGHVRMTAIGFWQRGQQSTSDSVGLSAGPV